MKSCKNMEKYRHPNQELELLFIKTVFELLLTKVGSAILKSFKM